VDINAAYEGNITALCLALEYQPKLAELLILSGCNVNLHPVGGLSALMIAATKGDAILCQKLINAGADLRYVNAQGYSVEMIISKEHRCSLRIFVFKLSAFGTY
jgi:ankyrin repeat protein